MQRADIETEMGRRAAAFLPQRCLVVDYYRIRRRLAFPLPLKELPRPRLEVPGIPNYPWATWLSWELEERINTLGWAGQWLKLTAARDAARRDLATLATWRSYRQHDKLDLCTAHLARTMAGAPANWCWLGPVLQRRVQAALQRLVEEAAPLVNREFGRFQRANEILAQPEPHRTVHNIRLIGTTGVALAAIQSRHPAAWRLSEALKIAVEAWLALRREGLSEAVSYDGYVLDFLADWLRALPVGERQPLLERVHSGGFLDESYRLGAPGDVMQVAGLNDVEPRQMPFHASAQAKLCLLRPRPAAPWHLEQCRMDWLRADALAVLHAVPRRPRGAKPEPGALDAHYALVLRSGWKEDDLAVVIGASNSPAGHIHCSTGSILIGTRRHWFITAPGYQQYMPNSEREFTVGVASRNTPVINSQQQTVKAMRRLALEQCGVRSYRAKLDLTGCYPAGLKLHAVTRAVWLLGKTLVVTADRVAGRSLKSVTYHWHGHADAAWHIARGWAAIYLDGTTLWFRSPQANVTEANLARLRGSRGQLTLTARADIRAPVVWWIFAIAPEPPRFELRDRGSSLHVAGTSFVAD